MVGNKFNSWLILEEAERDKWGSRRYRCVCDCGNEKIVTQSDLKTNKSSRCRECGYKKDKKTVEIVRITTKGNNYRHGHNRSATYDAWSHMKSRCNPKCKQYTNPKTYKWYGAKGIKVCERWSSFDKFLEDMGEKPIGMQLDRIDGNGNYEPGNCRWVTPTENNHNRILKTAVFRDDLPEMR